MEKQLSSELKGRMRVYSLGRGIACSKKLNINLRDNWSTIKNKIVKLVGSDKWNNIHQ